MHLINLFTFLLEIEDKIENKKWNIRIIDLTLTTILQ